MIETITVGTKEIILVGTAHISQASTDEVAAVIEAEKPDTVAVELCAVRYESINNQDQWKNMDIVKVVKEGKAPLLMVNLILSSFQKRMGDKIGVKPGSEMIMALEKAKEFGCETHLADREVSVTLKRAWGSLNFFKKLKLLGQLLLGGMSEEEEEVSEESIEQLKEKDMLHEAIEEMGKELPEIKEVLIDERDKYLAQKIKEAPGNRIVAVVGAGHMAGIKTYIYGETDLDTINAVPPPSAWGTILKWGLPLGLLGVILYGFTYMDSSVSAEMIKRWILANGVLAALGAFIAGGHIITVLVAFVAAPITSLNPTIAAGWVSGLTEAWVRKPRVEDFENLSTDISTFKGFRSNEITRILLVVVLSNIGSMVGTFIGIPLIASLL